MKEQGKSSLLLPLGIGAGVLLLLAGMKNKAAAEPTPASPAMADSDTTPQLDETPAAGQIKPAAAPSYTAPVPQPSADTEQETTGDGQDDDDEQQEQPDSESGGNGEDNTRENYTDDSSADDTDLYSQGNSYTSTPAVRKPRIPAYPTGKQKFLPANTNSQARQATGKNTTAYRPSAYNPKQVRFDNRSMQPVNYRPGATNTGQQQQQITRNVSAPASNTANSNTPTPNSQQKIFPLRMGMNNPYVKEVQRRIGVPATGYFGTMTRTVLRNKYHVSEISETLYKQIISGKVMMARKPVTKPMQQQKRVPHKRTNVSKPQQGRHGKGIKRKPTGM